MCDYKYLILALCFLSVGACSTSSKQISDGGHGFITVNAIPWGVVYIDGKKISATPVIRLPLEPGVHQLKIERQLYKTHEQEVSVSSSSRPVIISEKLNKL